MISFFLLYEVGMSTSFMPPCLSKCFGNSALSNYCRIFTYVLVSLSTVLLLHKDSSFHIFVNYAGRRIHSAGTSDGVWRAPKSHSEVFLFWVIFRCPSSLYLSLFVAFTQLILPCFGILWRFSGHAMISHLSVFAVLTESILFIWPCYRVWPCCRVRT